DDLTALVVTTADKFKRPGSAYYAARKYLTDLITAELTFKPVPEAMQAFDITKPFDMNRAAFVYAGEDFLGIIGEFRADVRRSLKLPKYTAGFEVDTAKLAEVTSNESKYVSLPRFPKVGQDITLRVPSQLSFRELFEFMK